VREPGCGGCHRRRHVLMQPALLQLVVEVDAVAINEGFFALVLAFPDRVRALHQLAARHSPVVLANPHQRTKTSYKFNEHTRGIVYLIMLKFVLL